MSDVASNRLRIVVGLAFALLLVVLLRSAGSGHRHCQDRWDHLLAKPVGVAEQDWVRRCEG